MRLPNRSPSRLSSRDEKRASASPTTAKPSSGPMVASTIALTAIPPYRLTAQVLSPRDSAVHALNRLAYGPRPGDVDRVAQGGVMTWIEQQLAPERIDDARLAERERRFDLLSY